ncbi:MAG: hypothetical protein QOI48_2372 [Solirubrobacteraceae bacterium]|jgi:hypothetical protein|nr:hypothetical protein [Solirubrobacteraceae bacterium]
MMVLVARGLARLLALLLTTVLAVAGLVVAVFSVQGGSATLSLPGLVRTARLDDLHAGVGGLLADIQAGGATAKVAALTGGGAIVLGMLLLFGVLGRRRPRLVIIKADADGTIAARPRAVGQAAIALGERSRDVLHVKAKTRPRRRGSGARLRLTAYHTESTDRASATASSRSAVQGLAESLSLRVRVRGRVPRRAGRVS